MYQSKASIELGYNYVHSLACYIRQLFVEFEIISLPCFIYVLHLLNMAVSICTDVIGYQFIILLKNGTRRTSFPILKWRIISCFMMRLMQLLFHHIKFHHTNNGVRSPLVFKRVMNHVVKTKAIKYSSL